jgi:hypothetical protein
MGKVSLLINVTDGRQYGVEDEGFALGTKGEKVRLRCSAEESLPG